MAIGSVGHASTTSMPARSIIESVAAERQRMLSISVVCCIAGLLLHTAFLLVLPDTQDWEVPLILGCMVVVLLMRWLNHRKPEQINFHAFVVILAVVLALLGRIVAVYLGDYLRPASRSVHLGVYFYLPTVFICSVLLFTRPWSTVTNTVMWLLVAGVTTGMMLWQIGWAPERQGYLTLLSLLWFGYPVFVLLLLQVERYLGHIQALQMQARLGEDFLLQARDAERARVEIGRANRLLARQNEDVEQFSAALSHDLKSPVQLMVMNAQTLMVSEAGQDPQVREALAEIVSNGAQCHQLMNALVRFVRVGRQPLQRELLNMNALVDELTAGYRSALQASNSRVMRSGELPEIFGDSVLLTEMLRNLVDNGLKYNDTPEKLVEISAPSPSGGFVVIAVQDNGIGMPPDKGRDASMLFGRLPGAERYGEGTGVGLAFVQKIVSLHGGWVQFDAPPQGGTRALIGLPSPQRGDRRGAEAEAGNCAPAQSQ